ncbi:MAG: ABC transporter ATP-binding protein [Candidatus Bipolaricaulota bacterium]|nr:MAG: ABC transporter ATP-binding protein [Candidatus Bipolaricaulota bacterium]
MGFISLRGVTKRYGKVTAVDRLSLEIEKGEFHTLLGPSGCGKTTTLRMIAGLEELTDGELFINERCVYSASKAVHVPAPDRGVGLIFQSYALWPHMTVYHNIAFGLKERKVPKDKIRATVMGILEKLQMTGYEGRYPSELSGGEQQRVAIARMVVTEPPAFLMDEPLSNLDAKLRMRLRSELKRLHNESGATTVYVTHDQVEALTLSNRVTVMRLGLLQQDASPAELYNRPSNLFVADFMGNPQINRIDGHLTGANGERIFESGDGLFRMPLEGLETDVEPGREVALVTHPEWLETSVVPLEGAREMNVYTVLMAGCETLIFLHAEGQTLATREQGQSDLQPDQKVWVRVRHFNLYDSASEELLSVGGTGSSC